MLFAANLMASSENCTVKHHHNTKSAHQSIKVICNARNVVHKLESEARAVASGRVLMVIEKVGPDTPRSHMQSAQHLPVLVERQHVEVGDVVGVRRLQSSFALGFVNQIADVFTHKLTLHRHRAITRTLHHCFRGFCQLQSPCALSFINDSTIIHNHIAPMPGNLFNYGTFLKSFQQVAYCSYFTYL